MYNIVMLKRVIKTIAAVALIVAVTYVLIMAYLFLKFIYVWNCQVYTGRLTPEAEQVCNDYNTGGLKKVLTKLH